jgi:hypothetical protein
MRFPFGLKSIFSTDLFTRAGMGSRPRRRLVPWVTMFLLLLLGTGASSSATGHGVPVTPSTFDGSLETPSRKLVWSEGKTFIGWGCSECAWVFHPSGPPIGSTMDQMKEHFKEQLDQEFEAHVCTRYQQAKA